MKLRSIVISSVLLVPAVAAADGVAPPQTPALAPAAVPDIKVDDVAVKKLAAVRRAADEKSAPSFKSDPASAETRRALDTAFGKSDITEVRKELDALAPTLKKLRDAAATRTSVNPREVDAASKQFALPSITLSSTLPAGKPMPLPTRAAVGGNCYGAVRIQGALLNLHFAPTIDEWFSAKATGGNFGDVCHVVAWGTTEGVAGSGDKVRIHVKGTASLLAMTATGGTFAATGSAVQVRMSMRVPGTKPMNIPAAEWAATGPHYGFLRKNCQFAVVWASTQEGGAVDAKSFDGPFSGSCEMDGVADVASRWLGVDVIGVTSVYTGLAGVGAGKAKVVPTSIVVE